MRARSLKQQVVLSACLSLSAVSVHSGLLPKDLVAVWHMDEGEGTSVSDASGRGHHGILNGAAGEWAWTAGISGKGLRFNGGEQSPYILIPNHEDFRFGTGSFTLEAWIRSDGIRNNGYGEVVLGTNWASSCGISLSLIRDPASGNPLPVFTVATGAPNSVQSGWTIPTDAWIHLAGVRDAEADRIRLFVNGELAGTAEDASGSLTSDQWAISGQVTWVGTVHGCFHGVIDEVTVTDRPLSALEIRGRYEAHAGALEVSFDYPAMATYQAYPMARLYDAEWRHVSTYGPFMPQPARFSSLAPGDYYLWTGMFVDESRCGNAEFYPFNDPYVSSYYNGSPDQAGAAKIHVASPGTTRLGPVRIDAAYFICVTTSPEAFTFSADHPSCVFTAPQHFAWKAGETHSLAAPDTVDWPRGGRYVFNHWSQGGSRIQEYAIPAGTVKDTLIARYVLHVHVDVVSGYGTPEGEGWHPAWRPVTILSLIHISEPTRQR
ncbi:MAG: LamG domain-containing protein, partial [bacterium]|nr:LamG domain-containing protein [bacterium]